MSRDRSWNDGDKLSFSERDRLRREGRHDSPREQGVSKAQEERAKQQHRKQLDGLFSSSGDEAKKLEAAVDKAHGSPGLADACRAYRDAAGYPKTARMIGMFLDSDDSELLVGSLEAALVLAESGDLEFPAGLRSQIRRLVNGSDNQVATLAEDLLERQ